MGDESETAIGQLEITKEFSIRRSEIL
jgi:hypothetical protein